LPKLLPNIKGIVFFIGAPCISIHAIKTVQDRAIYNGGPTASRIWSIEWRHFQ